MKKFLLGTVGVLAMAAPAFAADLGVRAPIQKAPAYVQQVFSWTGFYVGAQLGGQWGSDHDRNATPAGVLVIDPAFTSSGVVGGAHIGYNWQASSIVFGLEGDLEGSSMSGGYRTALGTAGTDFTNRWQASIRGRLGLAADRALFYVTGGGAWADLRYNEIYPTGSQVFTPSRFGWTLGAGVEYAFTPNWSARLEYRYADFGRLTNTITAIPASVGFTDTHDPRFHTVRAGVSYHFGGPVVARY